MIPIALSVYLWGILFLKKNILINSDNKAVVEILNNKTSKSVRVMSLNDLNPINKTSQLKAHTQNLISKQRNSLNLRYWAGMYPVNLDSI
jgi:hypothetical protein